MRARVISLAPIVLAASLAVTAIGCGDNQGTQRVMESPSPAPEDDVGVGGGLSGDGYISPEGQTGSSHQGSDD